MSYKIHPASYKDPAGFIFKHNNLVYRQVNEVYATHYTKLIGSGLYDALTNKNWLIPHAEQQENITGSNEWYKTLLPEQIPFVSYPYEWSFDMLKDAALLTLYINKTAVEHGMILKDATPFNIQYRNGKPVFIDTLSFEIYDETRPWIAYRQFCECFLFPLLITHYTKTDAIRLLSVLPDGISAVTTAGMLPVKSYFNLAVLMHVYLQKNIQLKSNMSGNAANLHQFSRKKLILLLNGLIIAIKKLSFTIPTAWSNYYTETILSEGYLQEKEKIFRAFLDLTNCRSVLDMGANDGYFSAIAKEKGHLVVATDSDSGCINTYYRTIGNNKIQNVLPLVIDISNPSPAIGFANMERESFLQRMHFDVIIALALIHHLVLGKNIPLSSLSSFFSDCTSNYLIIEFVPLQDEKAQLLVQNKSGSYHNYTQAVFEDLFGAHFKIESKAPVKNTHRVMYLMKKI